VPTAINAMWVSCVKSSRFLRALGWNQELLIGVPTPSSARSFPVRAPATARRRGSRPSHVRPGRLAIIDADAQIRLLATRPTDHPMLKQDEFRKSKTAKNK
jgi:hypothetical protein